MEIKDSETITYEVGLGDYAYFEYVCSYKKKSKKWVSLESLEKELDELNFLMGKKGNYCVYCASKEYDHKGIIHTEDCIMSILRKKLKGE